MTSLIAGGLVAATFWAAATARDAWKAAPARARAAALAQPRPAGGGPTWLAVLLADAGMPGTARAWTRAWIALAGTALVLGWLGGGPVTALLAVAAAGIGPRLLLSARRGRSAAAIEAALPPVLEATARGLRAGASLPVALAAASSGAAPVIVHELAEVTEAAADQGLVAALDGWAATRQLPGVRLAAAALALSAEIGGGGARALDGVALTLRQRQAVAGEIRSLATQARLSAVVLTLAPVAFAALAAAGDPRTATALLRSQVGQACLAAGLGLDALGAVWMARITRAGAT